MLFAFRRKMVQYVFKTNTSKEQHGNSLVDSHKINPQQPFNTDNFIYTYVTNFKLSHMCSLKMYHILKFDHLNLILIPLDSYKMS